MPLLSQAIVLHSPKCHLTHLKSFIITIPSSAVTFLLFIAPVLAQLTGHLERALHQRRD